jgi:adenylylsulfate kinase-like enzyme
VYFSAPNDASSQYEPPEHAEIVLRPELGLDERVDRILEHLMRQVR